MKVGFENTTTREIRATILAFRKILAFRVFLNQVRGEIIEYKIQVVKNLLLSPSLLIFTFIKMMIRDANALEHFILLFQNRSFMKKRKKMVFLVVKMVNIFGATNISHGL